MDRWTAGLTLIIERLSFNKDNNIQVAKHNKIKELTNGQSKL